MISERKDPMTDSKETTIAGFDQLKDLIALWSSPITNGAGVAEDNVRRGQALAQDLQKILTDGYGEEMKAVLEGNEQIRRSFQDLLQIRQPHDLLAAQTEFLALVMERVSQRAKRWSETSQKIGDCCCATANEAADEMRRQAVESQK
jgi:hypothetical protein